MGDIAKANALTGQAEWLLMPLLLGYKTLRVEGLELEGRDSELLGFFSSVVSDNS